MQVFPQKKQNHASRVAYEPTATTIWLDFCREHNMTMKLYKGNILYTPQKERFEVREHGYIAVDEKGLIEGVYQVIPEHLQEAEIVDFGDQLIIPAMNDLHVHAPQYRNMGLAMDLELLPWLNRYTFPEEKKFADVQYAERIYKRFVHELWMQGTMRSAIFATIHPESTIMLGKMLQESGMGAFVGLVGMNRNCPGFLHNSTSEVVRDTKRLIEVLGTDGSSLVKPIITPRFVPSCTNDMMAALGELAQEYQLPVQSHLSENTSEVAWVQSLEPESKNYGDAYYKYGLFGQTPTLMAHCCYTEGEELELMKRMGVYAVHCPTSNTNLASGIAPIRTLIDNGVRVALGTDVSGGNNLSVLRVIQYCLQMSKLIYAQTKGKTTFLSLSEAFYLATKSGGSFFGKVGSFETGYEFDALVINDDYLNFDNYSLPERLERYIYLGDDRDIRHRFCRGNEIKEPQI